MRRKEERIQSAERARERKDDRWTLRKGSQTTWELKHTAIRSRKQGDPDQKITMSEDDLVIRTDDATNKCNKRVAEGIAVKKIFVWYLIQEAQYQNQNQHYKHQTQLQDNRQDGKHNQVTAYYSDSPCPQR